MDEKKLREIQSAELKAVAQDAVKYYQQAIERSGYVMTEALRNDFDLHIIESSEMIAAEIAFRYYGRFKDMKVLKYGDLMPPIEVITEFVEKIGVSKFAWVPGYEKNGKTPALSVAVKRIASAIAVSFRNKGIKREGKGWYNQTTSNLVIIARSRIMAVTADYTAKMIAENIEKEIEVKVAV